MTPEHSPYPIQVTHGLALEDIGTVAEWIRETKVGYCVVKAKRVYRDREYALWRAEIPSDKLFVERQGRLSSFRGFLERGRTDGPKPETKAWDERIVETWKPDKEE